LLAINHQPGTACADDNFTIQRIQPGGGHVGHWTASVRHSIEEYSTGLLAGIEAGDFSREQGIFWKVIAQ